MNPNHIDTRIGTDNDPSYSNGNCLPYTGVPFGMNYFAPQNGEGSWWFNPRKRRFDGFRVTHQPSPWMGDFSHLLITPFTGKPELKSVYHLQSSYRPEEAIFAPHLTQIQSLRYGLLSRITASTYGMKLATKSENDQAIGFVLSAENGIRYHWNQTTLEGSVVNFAESEDPNLTFYFAIRFNTEVSVRADAFENGEKICRIQTDASDVTLSFASSFISQEQATLNLSREVDTFAQILDNAEKHWLKYLKKIVVKDKKAEQVSMFYHALYRCFLFPMTFFEYDAARQTIHYDTYSKTVRKGKLYTNNGFWDTYKSVYPLFSLIATDDYENMLEGFLNSYRNTGYLPKWLSPDERGLMPGTLVDAVIADALTKDIGIDIGEALLEAMVHGANHESKNPNYGRRAVNDYRRLNYVPSEYHESVNQTLDNAYSDFCIAQAAKKLGNESLYQEFISQSQNYRELFDQETQFMRGKNKDGQFDSNFVPHRWGGAYTEGSAWQNSWAVYHDFNGLISLFKSPDAFIDHITKLVNQQPQFEVGSYGFEIHEMSEVAALDFGQVAISNQPSFHLPYLFTYAKKPTSTQVLLKQLMVEAFKPTYDGYPGDEDNGSMSAWYVFNACGFYPVAPGTGEYVRGIPLFDVVTILLSNGETLEISSAHNTPHLLFVDSVKVNNHPYQKIFFTHQEILKGMNIHFNLGIVPRDETYTDEDLPFSLTP